MHHVTQSSKAKRPPPVAGGSLTLVFSLPRRLVEDVSGFSGEGIEVFYSLSDFNSGSRPMHTHGFDDRGAGVTFGRRNRCVASLNLDPRSFGVILGLCRLGSRADCPQ